MAYRLSIQKNLKKTILITDMNNSKEVKTSRGGAREGAGRKSNDRDITLSVRVSQEAIDKLNGATKNKSQYIDNLIKKETTMPIINLSKNIRTVEHSYISKNHRCIDYAILYTMNGEERFVGYTRVNTLSAIVGETADYTDLIRRYEQNAEMPSWIKEAIA